MSDPTLFLTNDPLYLAWVRRADRLPTPQLWHYDFRKSIIFRQNPGLLAMCVVLSDEDRGLSLDELARKYPMKPESEPLASEPEVA